MATTKKIDAKIKALAEELVAENHDKNVLFGEKGVAKQLQKRLLGSAPQRLDRKSLRLREYF